MFCLGWLTRVLSRLSSVTSGEDLKKKLFIKCYNNNNNKNNNNDLQNHNLK